MAEKTSPGKPRRDLPGNRLALVGIGVLAGAMWGAVMWLLTTLLGQESGLAGFGYMIVTMAMIGGGVAGIFGASMVRRRGERVAPKLRRRK